MRRLKTPLQTALFCLLSISAGLPGNTPSDASWIGDYKLESRYATGWAEIHDIGGGKLSVRLSIQSNDTAECGDRQGCYFEGAFVPAGMRAVTGEGSDGVFLEIDPNGHLAFMPVSIGAAGSHCGKECAPDYVGVFTKEGAKKANLSPGDASPASRKMVEMLDGRAMQHVQGGPVRLPADPRSPGTYRWSERSTPDFLLEIEQVRCWQYSLYCALTGKVCEPCRNPFDRQLATFAEASEYARFYGKRLPTRDEWLRTATGGVETLHLFGNTTLRLNGMGVPGEFRGSGEAWEGSSFQDILSGAQWVTLDGKMRYLVGAGNWRDLPTLDEYVPELVFEESHRAGFRCAADPYAVKISARPHPH